MEVLILPDAANSLLPYCYPKRIAQVHLHPTKQTHAAQSRFNSMRLRAA
jgi:hypothetical protein